MDVLLALAVLKDLLQESNEFITSRVRKNV